MPSLQQARDLLQLISEGFVFVDAGFRVREMNAEAERIEGRPASELIGRRLWDAWPGLEDSELGRLWKQATRDKQPVALEHLYRWPDGREAWLEMRAYPADAGLAIFFRDVGDKKRSEEELKRTQAELIHASRISAMGTMAATLAHELAQPLTSASNYLAGGLRSLARLPSAEARPARQALGNAAAAVDRALEILKRLRAFVGKGQVRRETHDLSSIIADAGILVLPEAQRHGVEIRFELDRQAQWVKADPVQVQQVLVNLIKNSIEAMSGAEERRITVSTAALSPKDVEVAVEDTGPGLDALSEEEVFVPFRSTKEEGMGVGLSVSRTIVEAHGGRIEARPRHHGGALFRFTLPRSSGPR